MIKKNCFIRNIFTSLYILAMVGCTSIDYRTQENINSIPSSDGSRISYGVKGDGETTIVFVHCWTCNHEFWRPQIEYFSHKYKVVWVDLAGHGISGTIRKEYKMSSFGEDVAAVVNEVGGDKVILVGHSMGGPVSIEASEILGEKVIAVVGVDSFYTEFKYPNTEEEIDIFIDPYKKDYAGSLQQLLKHTFIPSVNTKLKESIVNQFLGANQAIGINAMRELFVWYAENVPYILEKNSYRLENINGAPVGNENITHKSVTLIPGVGHFVPQVKPYEFNSVLNKVIKKYM